MENSETIERVTHTENLEDKNKNKKKTKRNSSIELLKIIAIIFVVLSHSMPDGDINKSSAININYGTNFQMFVIQIMHNLGQIANCIFLVCSAWFLVDSKKAKGEKIATLIGDVFFEGIVTLVIAYIIGYRFSEIFIIKQLTPVIFGISWFVSCYILLYAVHPFLNIIIDKLDNKRLCSLTAFLFVMYCCIYFVLKNNGFYYSDIIGFITIYFITAYVKRRGLYKKFMRKKFSIGLIILCLLSQMAINILSSYITAKTGKGLYLRWNAFINPLFILIALGSVGIALNKNFNNKIINYFSSLSLLIFIYHCNGVMRYHIRFDFFQYVLDNYSYTNLLGWCFVFFIIILSYAVIASIIYKSVFKKYMDKISIVIYRKTSTIWNKIIDIIN